MAKQTKPFKTVVQHLEQEIKEDLKTTEKYKYEDFCYYSKDDFNKWILISNLQKSIRRGLVKQALLSAIAVWRLDDEYIWRRLLIIGFEDIGLGNWRGLLKVAHVCAYKSFRTKTEHSEILLLKYCVELLCCSIKDRTLNDFKLCTTLVENESLDSARNDLAYHDDNSLQLIAMGDGDDLIKGIAMRYLLGINEYSGKNAPNFKLREGSPKHWLEVVEHYAKDNPELIYLADVGRKRCGEGLAMGIGLLYDNYRKENDKGHVSVNSEGKFLVHKLIQLNGKNILSCALDWHTTEGKKSLGYFRKKYQDEMFILNDGNEITTRTVGMAVFRTEGHCVDKRLCSSTSNLYYDYVDEWLLKREGVENPLPIIEFVRDKLTDLHNIRKKIMGVE